MAARCGTLSIYFLFVVSFCDYWILSRIPTIPFFGKRELMAVLVFVFFSFLFFFFFFYTVFLALFTFLLGSIGSMFCD